MMPRPNRDTLRILILLVLLVIVFSSVLPVFRTTTGAQSVLDRTVYAAPLAAGESVVLLAGQIDLSIGSMEALASTCSTLVKSIPLALLVGLVVGAILGLINGLVVTLLRVNSFITTLGTMLIWRGVVFTILTTTMSAGRPIANLKTFNNPWLLSLVSPRLLLILGMVFVVGIFVHTTRWGLDIKALPSAAAAEASGVRVKRRTALAFVVCGACAGFAGAVASVSMNSSSALLGVSNVLPAIAACVIGGNSLMGGKPSVVGAFLGVLTLGSVDFAMTQMGLSTYSGLAVMGGILLVMVVVDSWQWQKEQRDIAAAGSGRMQHLVKPRARRLPWVGS